MDRLIDADALERRYVPIAPIIQGDDVRYEWVVFAKDVDEQPTVYAEKPIHCKDCKYWDNRFGRNRCNRFALIENDKLQTHVCTQYDFCSYAEKE